MTDDRPGDADGDRLDATEQRTAVRDRYARIATEQSGCDEEGTASSEAGSCCDEEGTASSEAGSCCDEEGTASSEAESCCGEDGTASSEPESCCGDGGARTPAERARELGYSADDLEAVGPGANLGLGCGNPTAIADLEAGDTVLDLGAGGGFDCLLAARAVGPTGRVVGVDMTPEMVERARENVPDDATNVEFRLAEMEHLPVADESVDVVVSNCAVNLSPDKPQVFREAYRVLRPGGRLAVSDVVLAGELPPDLRTDPASVAACVGGASSPAALEAMLTDAGFTNVAVDLETDGEASVRDPDDAVVAATIEGEKPAP